MIGMMRRTDGRKLAAEFLRYFAVSALALAVDMACLLLAAEYVHYLLAATLGFLLGATVSYVLAVRWAFDRRRLESSPRTEFAVYALIGVTGLGINNLTIFLAVESLGLSLWLAKACAAAITFLFNFSARKWGLFHT